MRQPATAPIASVASGRGPIVTPLLVLCAAQFILQLDFSIVNIALKTIQGDLGFSDAGLQWVATSYALTFGSLLMLGGRLGDRVGRRRLLIGGLWLFAAASLACGLATTPGLLIAARFLQGAAAAAIAPMVIAMLTAIYADGHQRVRALGIWAGSVAAGGTAGIITGGLLTDLLGWRSIFLVNLPVIALLLAAMRRTLPEVGTDRIRSLDPFGAVSVTFAVAAMIFGLTNGEQHGFDDPLTLAALASAVVLGSAFAINEKRAAEPMIDPGFLAAPIRRVSTLSMALVGSVLAAYMFFIALALQRVLGYSPLETGLALIPAGATMAASSFLLAHRLIARFGLRPTLIAGIGCSAIGMLIFSRIAPGTEYLTELLPGLILNSIGFGLMLASLSIGITKGVAPRDQGTAGSLVPASQQIGGATGLAILATLAAAVSRHEGGNLVSGYEVGFLAAAGILLVTIALVATTSFKEIESGPG